ncbi:MAG: efflux RND transporter periplasmic adaptor subunit [Verrucomicrobiae bacterium]|nr:efflux RND transporter periplasmic adaptor subunit [Verrucomicrobiae bacterium]
MSLDCRPGDLTRRRRALLKYALPRRGGFVKVGLAVAVVIVAIAAWVAIQWALGARTNSPASLAGTLATNSPSFLVCVGRVEPVDGEVDVSAQMAGTLVSVSVKEGERVEAGALLATVDARREKAQLELAEARLARVRAGFGAEEIAATAAQRDALAAELVFAESELARARKLKTERVLSDDVLEARQQRVDSLKKQVVSLQKQLEAMQRGPLPEEVAVARAEVAVARANHELHEVRAPFAGTILQLHRRAGDQVLLNYPTPILRMADTERLQVRVEVHEADVYRIRVGAEGSFTALGAPGETGRLRVRMILPAFGPKRLFDPDTSARIDTRTLQVLCEIVQAQQPTYSGQRVSVRFRESP